MVKPECLRAVMKSRQLPRTFCTGTTKRPQDPENGDHHNTAIRASALQCGRFAGEDRTTVERAKQIWSCWMLKRSPISRGWTQQRGRGWIFYGKIWKELASLRCTAAYWARWSIFWNCSELCCLSSDPLSQSSITCKSDEISVAPLQYQECCIGSNLYSRAAVE